MALASPHRVQTFSCQSSLTSYFHWAHSRQEPAIRTLYLSVYLTSPQTAAKFRESLKAHPSRGSLVEDLYVPPMPTGAVTLALLSAILDHTPNLIRLDVHRPSYETLDTISRQSGSRLQELVAITYVLPLWTTTDLNRFFKTLSALRFLELVEDILHADDPRPTTFAELPHLQVLIIQSSTFRKERNSSVSGVIGFLSLVRYVNNLRDRLEILHLSHFQPSFTLPA